jgi:hypothetical protein
MISALVGVRAVLGSNTNKRNRAKRGTVRAALVGIASALGAVAGVSGWAEYVPTGNSSASRRSQRSYGD